MLFAIIVWIAAISRVDAMGKISPIFSSSASFSSASLPTSTQSMITSQPSPQVAFCQQYPSNGYCSNYINYSVYVGNSSFNAIDLKVAHYAQPNSTTFTSSTNCSQTSIAFACSMFYPKCLSSTREDGTGALLGCYSQCNAVHTACPEVPINMLPNCTDKLNLQFDPNCLKPVLIGSTNSNPQPTCPFPFLPDPLANSNLSSSPYCLKGCCLKCPAQNVFYKENMVAGLVSTNVIRFLSALLAGFMALSYLLLPDKRSHPSAIILMLSISIFIFSIIAILPILNARAIQCHDEVTPSNQSNNGLCAFQGGVVIFSSFSTCCWVAALILNMHISIVWNSNFFSTRYILLNSVCWGMPCLMTILSLANHYVQFEFGTLCLLSIDVIYGYFFYPLIIIIMPAFVLHLATFFYIARISMKQGIETELSRSVTSSGTKSRSLNAFSHQRHVINAFKIQWRALLIAVIASMTVIMYWIFYVVQVEKFNAAKENAAVVGEWLACVVSNPTSPQDNCADIIGPYIPSYGVVIFTETLVSMVGLWLFVVFMRKSLLQEWQDWIYDINIFRANPRNNSKSEKDEQFFSL